jgi:hypothetical protein
MHEYSKTAPWRYTAKTFHVRHSKVLNSQTQKQGTLSINMAMSDLKTNVSDSIVGVNVTSNLITAE